MRPSLLVAWLATAIVLPAQIPDSIVTESVPAVPTELRADVSRYLEFRSAAFNNWHPTKREMLITTRFADATQLHLMKNAGGARKQITFGAEPVAGGQFQPKTGEFVVFAQDLGGSEFYQFYRLDLADGRTTLVTDGKSRNGSPKWPRSGKQLAFTSTRRNGKDNDIWIVDPLNPASARMLSEVTGGGWRIFDWSRDETKLLAGEYISINESYVHIVDVRSGATELITPKGGEKVAWSKAQFTGDGRGIFVTTDKDSEFQRLCRLDLASRQLAVLTKDIRWDVENFELSPDGRTIAFVSNENGVGVLHFLDARNGKAIPSPNLPLGTVSNLEWHNNSRDLAFNLSSAKSPNDVYSLDFKTGKVERWTESETGGLNTERFVEPQLIRTKSFDGLNISAFVYRPDPSRFPGKRPVIISIHGGPESQSRAMFQARNNYFLNELGVAVVYPNVRGSDGYGKTFLTLDNGFKREDSVRDIGAIIDWIASDAGLDAQRVAVMGGSYGGYMTLACMTHFSDRLRCGVDVVGISNFLTFLKNTQDYRRDLRRAEYGDERDPKMAEFLGKISPLTSVKEIRKPLLVVQGKNDPRVPLSEAEQMVKAIRDNSGTVWYVMAKDEGHGFARKKNADYQFMATILFFREFLLK
jgi:dipeptidyl aminopeptidase/acylaminoacyl peptidase